MDGCGDVDNLLAILGPIWCNGYILNGMIAQSWLLFIEKTVDKW